VAIPKVVGKEENVVRSVARESRSTQQDSEQKAPRRFHPEPKHEGKSPISGRGLFRQRLPTGENLGEHGLWWKNALYEQAARVPLIVSRPARWRGGQRRTGACGLVDVVQTLAELGGTRTPPDWDGDSLVPWLDRPDAPWKDRAISQYYAHDIASGYAMIRSGRYKYVYHTAADAEHPAQRELYDLQADPAEFHNLASQSGQQSLIAKLHAALAKELGEAPEATEKRCRADLAKGYGEAPKAIKKKRATAEQAETE